MRLVSLVGGRGAARISSSFWAVVAGKSLTSPSPRRKRRWNCRATPSAARSLYSTTCAACHGLSGEGVVGLGKDLVTSSFTADRSDLELVEFLTVGRAVGDPLNTTGIMMPARGGNPSLTDQQLADIVAYLRTIHQEPGQ